MIQRLGHHMLGDDGCPSGSGGSDVGKRGRLLQSLAGRSTKTMHPMHQDFVMAMEIHQRLQRLVCRTTQTGADRRQRMVNGRVVAALAWPTWRLGVKPRLLLLGSCPAGVQVGSQGRSAHA